MRMRVALCQICPVMGDAVANTDRIVDMLGTTDANVLVFPESFLAGYGIHEGESVEMAEECLDRISEACRAKDKAVAVGVVMSTPDGPTNSLAFLSPDGDSYYDKTHLARFGIYSEDGYVAGSGPSIGWYHGVGFGFSICYDIYFPEILHTCSLEGAGVNICISAAAKPSAPFFARILPARALENVSYLAFVNNIGTMNGLEMAGTSCAYDPLGVILADCGDTEERIETFVVDTEELEKARGIRRHLTDFRRDIHWLGESF